MGWNFAFSGHCVALLHADYVNFDSVSSYLHWGFETPTWNFELSARVTDELAKYCVDFNGLAASILLLAEAITGEKSFTCISC